jgi:hypothetical protein
LPAAAPMPWAVHSAAMLPFAVPNGLPPTTATAVPTCNPLLPPTSPHA